MLSFAAILQYRSYWDFFNEMTTTIDYRYFFALSIITVLAYRYILEEDFGYYAKTVPFEIAIDEEFETYFYLNSYIKLNDKWLQRLVNYFYNEWFEMLIGVIVWKGVYDLAETGSQHLFLSVQPNAEKDYWISFIFTGVFGYSVYFLWLLFDQTIKLKTSKLFHKYSTYVIDFIDFIVYVAMVAIWRVIWEQFDLISYDSRIFRNESETGLFVICCFFGCIFIFSILGLNSNLFGLAGSPEGVFIVKKKSNKIEPRVKIAISSI